MFRMTFLEKCPGFFASFWCDFNKMLSEKLMRFYFEAENVSSYYECYLNYLETQSILKYLFH